MKEKTVSKFSGTVELEDHGQDFLTWVIEDGVVVDCQPFQGWVWKGHLVHNPTIAPGDILVIEDGQGNRTTLNYPVAKVKVKGSV